MTVTPVGATVLVRDGDVLLVEEGKPAVAGEWGLPGGRLGPGEAPAAGARRETREETGLVVDLDGALGVYLEHSPVTESGTAVVFAFLARVDDASPRVRPDDSVRSTRWFGTGELAEVSVRGPAVRRAIADWQAGRVLPIDAVVDLR